MLNGLDLFSGIGGLTIALEPWVRPIAYCENDRYAQSVLLSRMRSGEIATAPIWDDVRTLRGDLFRDGVDIISGGFPCQDISVAGTGKGLAGERSGLFFEIVRLARELRPKFIFSWKTSQLSLIEELNGFAWNSLRFGMIVGGRLSQPANLEPVTCVKVGGFVPTPTARDFKSPGVSRTRKANVQDRRGVPLSVWFKVTYGTRLFPGFVEWMMGYGPKHTALEPWAMLWFQSKQGKRSKN